jgi:hypothetical protein
MRAYVDSLRVCAHDTVGYVRAHDTVGYVRAHDTVGYMRRQNEKQEAKNVK